MTRVPNPILESIFRIFVNAEGDIQATLIIHPDDRVQSVRLGEEFTVRFAYTVGRPKVIDVPFRVYGVGRGINVDDPQPTLTVLSITPARPNIHAVADAEQTGVVTARLNRGDGQSGSKRYQVELVIEMTQPDTGTISNVGTRHSDANASIPNLYSREVDDGIEVNWDQPVDDDGNPVDAEIRVVITKEGEIIANRDYRKTPADFPKEKIDFGFLENTLIGEPTITHAEAQEILGFNILGITFHIKRDVPGTSFNDPETSYQFQSAFPFRVLEPRGPLNLVAATAFRNNYELVYLSWDMPPPSQPPIYDWNVRWKPLGSSDDLYGRWLSTGSAAPSVTIGPPNHPLTPGIAYTFQVRSVARFRLDNRSRVFGGVSEVSIRLTQ